MWNTLQDVRFIVRYHLDLKKKQGETHTDLLLYNLSQRKLKKLALVWPSGWSHRGKYRSGWDECVSPTEYTLGLAHRRYLQIFFE